jgi:hypothetical protein
MMMDSFIIPVFLIAIFLHGSAYFLHYLPVLLQTLHSRSALSSALVVTYSRDLNAPTYVS